MSGLFAVHACGIVIPVAIAVINLKHSRSNGAGRPSYLLPDIPDKRAMSFKFIHLTDTHLVRPGLKLYGLDPRVRLDAAIADINAHHGDAAFVVVTGDLTHWGEAEAYANFADAMATLEIPHVAMVGNHDRRRACIDALKAAPRDANGFVQGTWQTPHGLFVFLDTLDETSHAGEMCAKRLGWLAHTLAAAPADMPFVVFMHHPPFPVGIHAMDEIALKQSRAFAEVIAPYRARIRHLFFGHVHRPISGSYGMIPFSTLRGTNHQVAFELDPASEHLASHEPPAYGVALVERETLVVHTHDYLDASPRFPFKAPRGLDHRDCALAPPVS
jgi:3',5'-cyclic-AMP phosphodiesterase